MTWTDDFNDGSLDAAKFGTSVAGGTTVTEGTDYLTVDEGTAASYAGIVYLKTKLDPSKGEVFIHKVKGLNMETGAGISYLLGILNKATAPAVDSNTAFNPNLRFYCYQLQSGAIYMIYINTAGTAYWWNGTAWSTTTAPAFVGSLDTWYVIQLVHDTSRWKFVLLSGDGAKELTNTDWVNFSTLKTPITDGLWVFWGDPYTNYYYGDTVSDFFRYGDAPGIVGYFNGRAAGGGADYRIGRAISYDGGMTFSRDPVTAVVEKTAFQADENVAHVKDPYVVLDGDTYYLWCAHYSTSTGKYSISCFTSSDGMTWTRSGTAAKVVAGSAGAPDENGCSFPVVVKDSNSSDPDKTWKIYYAGVDAAGTMTICLAYANGPTETAYVKYAGNPVLNVGATGSFDDEVVIPTDILTDGTTLRLYYGGGYPSAANKWNIGEAISQDWLTWQRAQTTPILESRSAVTIGITTLTAGTRTAAVGSTAAFVAKECVVLVSADESTVQLARIESIDSGTQATLSYPAGATFSGGKMKSLYFGSVSPAKIEKVGSLYRMWPVAFQHKDGPGFTLEVTGYAEGSSHNAFAYDLTHVPALPLGQSWDTQSAENFRGIGVPVSFNPANPIGRAVRLEITAESSAARTFALSLGATGAIGRPFRLPFSSEALIPIGRPVPLPAECARGVERRVTLPIESDGAIVLVRTVPMPIETVAALCRQAHLEVEWSAGILARAFVLPVEAGAGVGRLLPLPVEWDGSRILRRAIALPVETKRWLARKAALPVEAAGQTDSLSDLWRVQRALSEIFLDEWTIIPLAQVIEFQDSWSVRSAMGMELIDTWRVLPQQIIALWSGDIQLPSATMEKD